MTHGPSFKLYEQMKPEEQRFYNRWITANVVLSSVFVIGLAAMVVVSGLSTNPDLAKDNVEAGAATKIEPPTALTKRAPTALPPSELIIPVVDQR